MVRPRPKSQPYPLYVIKSPLSSIFTVCGVVLRAMNIARLRSIDDIKSIPTQSALDALCEKFHIPRTVHPELPGRNNRIRNSPTGKISLSVIAIAKISHFEILCRVHNFVPTNYHFFWVDASFFPLAVPWHNNKTLRKDPHPTPTEFNADMCNYLAVNPASFRKFSEPFLCFVGISRYYELDDNCYLTFFTDDDEMDLVAFIHHADPTKVRIGEREVGEGEVSLLELTRGRVVPPAGVNEQGNQNEAVQDVGARVVNDESGDATEADQIKESDHYVQDKGTNIVRIEDEVPTTVAERTKGSREKRKTAKGASSSSLPPKKLREDHGTSGSVASTGGKSVAALQGLLERSTLPVEVSVAAVAALPFITSSVSLMVVWSFGRDIMVEIRPQWWRRSWDDV
ncbi:hypothetical protein Tco_0290772 [Tanacetum coccineum]